MWFLAFRQLLSRKKQSFLILLGVAFGTMLYVFIAGIQLGFREYLSDALLNNTSHILISGSEQPIDAQSIEQAIYPEDSFVHWIIPPSGRRDERRLTNYFGWTQRLSADSRVYGYSPRLQVNAVFSKGPITHGATLIGVIPEQQARISSIEKYMIEGDFLNLSGAGGKVILGKGVADRLGARVGQTIQLSVGRGQEIKRVRVTGIVGFGDERVDQSLNFAHLSDVQTFYQTPGRIAQIAVALTDKDIAQQVAKEWQGISEDKVEDWQEANQMFMQMIKMQDIVRYFITFSILLVASFGVYNVLSIMIAQKRKEFAILRAIGFAPKKILNLVLIQGLTLGLLGAALGLGLGGMLNYFVSQIDLGFEIGGANHLMMSYDPLIFVTAGGAAAISAFFASFFPAYMAYRLTPMDIIREQG